MITPAVSTPSVTVISARLFFIPKSAATSDPVHAPVPGSGIATNRNSPRAASVPVLVVFSVSF